MLIALAVAPMAASANTIVFDGDDESYSRSVNAEFNWTYGAAPSSEQCTLERPGVSNWTVDCGSDIVLGLSQSTPTTRKWELLGLVVGDGLYKLTVVADFPGVPTSVEQSWNVYVDDTNPTLTVIGPTGLTNDNTIDVTLNASEGTVRCAMDPPSTTIDDILSWPICATGPRPAVADGQHTFVAVAVDLAGNTNGKSLSFTVDVTPPTINLTGISEGTIVPTPYPQYTLGSPDASSLQCFYDGNPALTCESISISPTGLADGDHKMHIVATDLAGNVATLVVNFVVNDTLDGPTPKAVSLRTGKVKATGKNIKVALAGGFTVAGNVDWAKACGGRVTITVFGKVGKKKKSFKAKTRAKRKGTGCVFNASLKAPRAWKGKRQKATVDYAGDSQLGSFSVTGKLRLKQSR